MNGQTSTDDIAATPARLGAQVTARPAEPEGLEPDGAEPDGLEPDGLEPDGTEVWAVCCSRSKSVV